MKRRKHLIGIVAVLAALGLLVIAWPRQASVPTAVVEEESAAEIDDTPVAPAAQQAPTATEPEPEPADVSGPDQAACKAGMQRYVKPSLDSLRPHMKVVCEELGQRSTLAP